MVSFKNQIITVGSRQVQFENKERMIEYLSSNFDKIKNNISFQLGENWIKVLAIVFGDVDWDNGIESYESPYARGYRGRNVFKEYGIAVDGYPIIGDAYYAYNGSIKWQKIPKIKASYHVAFKFYDLSGTHTDHKVCREIPFSQEEIAAEARRQMPNIMYRFGNDDQVITDIVEVCYPDQTQDSCGISATLNEQQKILIAAEWAQMNKS